MERFKEHVKIDREKIFQLLEEGKNPSMEDILEMLGKMDEINSITRKLGSIPEIQVKTTVSKKEMD